MEDENEGDGARKEVFQSGYMQSLSDGLIEAETELCFGA